MSESLVEFSEAFLRERGWREASIANGSESLLDLPSKRLDFSHHGNDVSERTDAAELHRNAMLESVKRILIEETRGQIQNLAVEYRRGKVTISGTAKSYYVKALANKASCCLDRDVQFINNIDVTGSASHPHS